ncbi:MAG: transporter [Spirochaetes bacterium]|nr:MAG: transporter [Spirochaetota bacterium]
MNIKKRIERFTTSFNSSKYAWPITFFVAVFLLFSAAVIIFEFGKNEQYSNFMDGLWWTIITFSTTGYGDKVPITTGGRIIAVVTIFIGVGGMSFLSGTLASVFVDRNTRARRGLVDFPKMKNHLIICGWKDHMKDILLDIVSTSKDLGSDMIIIVSNVPSEKIEELKEEKGLKGLNFVRGDYFSESSLRRANVKSARKVLILADTYESGAISEVDSKTVMTVLTIKAISKDIYTCAELMDEKYESYLKQALCDEIIYSRELNRRMIANTTITNGMSHIVFNLLSSAKSNIRLTTCGIPEEYIGKTYGEYKHAFRVFPNTMLIGVLENTGSPNRIKMEALREAQKTSDVSRLVSNLQQVKGLEVNKPVLIPEDNYVLRKYSQAIVLERI